MGWGGLGSARWLGWAGLLGWGWAGLGWAWAGLKGLHWARLIRAGLPWAGPLAWLGWAQVCGLWQRLGHSFVHPSQAPAPGLARGRRIYIWYSHNLCFFSYVDMPARFYLIIRNLSILFAYLSYIFYLEFRGGIIRFNYYFFLLKNGCIFYFLLEKILI